MAELSSYTIENFAGGRADEGKRGVPGAFKGGFNLNIHQKNRNTLSCNQKLKKISGTTVTDLIIKIVPITATKAYGFGDAGNVYKIENDTVTKIYTDSNGAILDAGYFYNYLYWTTTAKLGRCIETSADWNTDANPNWKTLENADYHQIYIVPNSDVLCVANDRYIARLSSTEVWNAEAVDLYYGWIAKCLTLQRPNLLIGAKDSEKAEMFTWDLTSESYDPVEGWEEKDIDAFLRGIGATYIFTPDLLYWFKEGLVDQAKELPTQVRHGAIDLWKGKMMFGCINGVYSYHKRNKNYPMALNLEYTPSPISIANFDSKSIEIGAILGNGNNFYVAWKDGSTYGLDNIDWSNKAQAVYEGLEFDANRPFEDKWFRFIKIVTKPLPTDCSVKVKYKMSGASSWTETKMAENDAESFADAGETKAIFQIEGQGEVYEVRVELYPNGNDTPEVVSINTYFEPSNIY